MCVYVCVCVCIYIYIYTCICIYIYIYICIRRPPRSSMPNLPTKIIPAKIYWLELSREFPMGLEISPLNIKIMFESNPLKSRIVVRRLAVHTASSQKFNLGKWAQPLEDLNFHMTCWWETKQWFWELRPSIRNRANRNDSWACPRGTTCRGGPWCSQIWAASSGLCRRLSVGYSLQGGAVGGGWSGWG